MSLLLVGLAAGNEVERSWETLNDARLVEAADGTPAVAALYYQQLLEEMAPGDPLYGLTCYWLGRARLELEDTDGAIEALREAGRDPHTRARADMLLAHIELDARKLRELPASIPFDGGAGPLVRAGAYAERGALEIRSIDGNPALAWNTDVRDGAPDSVGFVVEAGLEVRELRVRVRTTDRPAHLVVVLTDGAGASVEAPVLTVPVGEWLTVELGRQSFGPGSARGLRVVEIQDRSGVLTDARGRNTILLDDLDVR